MIRDFFRGIVKTASVKTVAKMEKRIEDKLNTALRYNIDKGIHKAKAELYNTMLIISSAILILVGTLLIISKYFSVEYFLIGIGTTLLFATLIMKN